MAYKVTFKAPERELGREDLEFVIKRDGRKIGTLKVSKGPLEWVPADHAPNNPHTIGWPEFDEFMKKQPRRRG
jgi:hypothetical protein